MQHTDRIDKENHIGSCDDCKMLDTSRVFLMIFALTYRWENLIAPGKIVKVL